MSHKINILIEIITIAVEKLSQILLLGHGEKLVSKTIETESVVDRAIITKTNNCLKMLPVDRWQLGAQQIFRVWKPNYLCHNVRNKIIHSMQNSKIHGMKIEIENTFPYLLKGDSSEFLKPKLSAICRTRRLKNLSNSKLLFYKIC